ncbi:FMN-binding glutamate synthase family protein [Gallaecimonas sp. GXIMD1310]|uniref:FMN-binding glutamate synthase family protein n=1 Tax=Gallaecimonas sp. GXIMD1310 TaxID=3131926 RepID=UPI00324963EA
MTTLDSVVSATIEIFVLILLLLVIGAIVAFFIAYQEDARQTRSAILRNYPVIGRFRYLFEHLGEFFRQYFYAMDREEMPFNRAQRTWCYKAAKNVDNTRAFGSTRDMSKPGTVLFLNTPYPTLDTDGVAAPGRVIGPYARHSYEAKTFFNISGMSFGALSKVAVEALSKGAAKAGCWYNTGEGGLSPYHLSGGCDIVFQIGTAKYGVRNENGQLDDDKLKAIAEHPQVKLFELKLSQGAKPGKGGMLPGAKVTEEIAKVRGIPRGEDSISPNRHPEIDSVDSLLTMVGHIREVTGKPCGIKFVLGTREWLDEFFTTIKQRGVEVAPDFITLDGADGGTGAAPMPLMDSVGLTLRESLPALVDKLDEYELRERIPVVASGKLITPTDVAWAIAMGADFVNSARGFLFSLGCIQSMQCNKNTCPTGITTHDPKLQRGLVPADKAERVAHYHANVEKEVGIIAHSVGVKEPRELRRHHAQVLGTNGVWQSLHDLHPEKL